MARHWRRSVCVRTVYVRVDADDGSRGEKESVPRASRTHATTERGGRRFPWGTRTPTIFIGDTQLLRNVPTIYMSFRRRDRDNYYTAASDANERYSWRRVAMFLRHQSYRNDR